MRRRTALALCLVFCAPSSACAEDQAPVDPVWGKQPCAHCAMLVSEPQFAAQALERDGTRSYFDDIGCMVLWLEKKGEAKAWAFEGTSRRWLVAEQAGYRGGERTPMDFGFVVVASGGSETWDAVRAAVRSKRKGP